MIISEVKMKCETTIIMLEVPRSKAGRRKYLEVTGAERAHPPYPALFIIIMIIIITISIIVPIAIIFCVNVPTAGTRRRLPQETATAGGPPLSQSLSRLHTFPVSHSIYVQICNMVDSNTLLLLRCIFRPAAPGEPDPAPERSHPPLHQHHPLLHDHLGHSLLLLLVPRLCEGLAIIGEEKS